MGVEASLLGDDVAPERTPVADAFALRVRVTRGGVPSAYAARELRTGARLGSSRPVKRRIRLVHTVDAFALLQSAAAAAVRAHARGVVSHRIVQRAVFVWGSVRCFCSEARTRRFPVGRRA